SGKLLFQGIHLPSVLPKAITYVRSACVPGHPNPTDNVSLAYKIALFHVLGLHVKVLGAIGAVVLDLHIFSIASPSGGFGDGAVCGSHNGCANGCGIVGALVWPYLVAIIGNPALQVVSGRQAITKLDGCPEECTPQIVGILIEVVQSVLHGIRYVRKGIDGSSLVL